MQGITSKQTPLTQVTYTNELKQPDSTQKYSDAYLLEFFENEINGNPEYAENIYRLVTQAEWPCASTIDKEAFKQKLPNLFSNDATLHAACKIVSYICGNLAKDVWQKPGANKPLNQPEFYFHQAAKLGFIPALEPLSECYLNGNGLTLEQGDPSYLAIEILNAASFFNTQAPAQTDNPDINTFLQALFDKKDPRATYGLFNLNRDIGYYEAAYQFLTIAVTEKNADAVTSLGWAYYRGSGLLGIEKDEQHGLFLLTGAANDLDSERAKKLLANIQKK